MDKLLNDNRITLVLIMLYYLSLLIAFNSDDQRLIFLIVVSLKSRWSVRSWWIVSWCWDGRLWPIAWCRDGWQWPITWCWVRWRWPIAWCWGGRWWPIAWCVIPWVWIAPCPSIRSWRKASSAWGNLKINSNRLVKVQKSNETTED